MIDFSLIGILERWDAALLARMNSSEESGLLNLMELCPGYAPGNSSWCNAEEAIWLGETTSMELGCVPQNYYTRI